MKTIQANLVDIISKTIFPAKLYWQDGRILKIEKLQKEVKKFLIPGFIDAHIHIESTMLTAQEFGRNAFQHGTVAVVADPHEIANVLGIDGVKFMIENGRKSPLKFFFGAPSCVPATPFETSGAELGPSEIEELLRMEEITHLGEMMNYPGVISEDKTVVKKLALARKYHKPIDGHAPGLLGKNLKIYVQHGITTEHECTTKDEALEKLEDGIKVIIREGSASKNYNELIPIAREHYQNCMFCCDDLHPQDLQKRHIDWHVKNAIRSGLDIFQVLQMACLNPVKHYKLDVGLLQVGDPADFLLVEDFQEIKILENYIDGKPTLQESETQEPPKINIKNNFQINEIKEEDFAVPARNGKLRVIKALDGFVLTESEIMKPKIEKGLTVADIDRDLLKIAVVNRYQNTKPVVGFITGFGLKKGAIASSIAHDSHNIVAVGTDDRSITKAVNLIIRNKGGICAVDKNSAEILSLPIAGIISDKSCQEVAEKHELLEQKAKELGSTLSAPFMTLSFMALLVIPKLKMSDKGLFDGEKFEFVDLWI
ncbi:MAG: adenine deaminase [Candidatus Cloacimonetes bacterium]|nr:adenine deaminase [Candidatus Cloacimonadota bacterium]MCF7814879.1 adenine deaminase [Candidatus Cloacimonadota bacterium]MCF7868154.1 adenine deaminase [Candidatus Cloacimonadota bacterium]MCF7884572.1 adenine deaminase [Candidatus Cloacimonadota bacterium]